MIKSSLKFICLSCVVLSILFFCGKALCVNGNISNPDELEGNGQSANIQKTNDLDKLEGDTTGGASNNTLNNASNIQSTETDNRIVCNCNESECKVCIEINTKEPLRVLPRPLSNLYKTQEASPQNILKANLPAFKPMYVFKRKGLDFSNPAEPSGWYRVGYSKTKPLGWLRAKDCFEWKQALLVSYTHPGEPGEGRNPVLMFKDLSALKEIVSSDNMEEKAKALYSKIDKREIPPEIVSMEPKRFVDINENFYLLPILNYETTEINGDEARFLQIAAAVPGKRGADTLSNPDYLEGATASSDNATITHVKNLKVNLVFVIDTTRSMQPYIDMTREAVEKIATCLGKDLTGRIKFGLVGYRDSTKVVPQLEYVAKNFTPELVDAKTLVSILKNEAKATSVGSHDYQEEVFAGVQKAMDSNWEEGALRFIVLIGDASSHPLGHPQNTTGLGAEDLLRSAQDQKIHIIAIHLKDPRASKDFDTAYEHFSTLSRVRGEEGESSLVEVDAFKKKDFQKAVNTIVTEIGQKTKTTLQASKGSNTGSLISQSPGTEDEGSQSQTDVTSVAKKAFTKAWNSALIEYLGQEASPPKDIVAWVLDRDLVDPTQKSLDVRVLITKNQLNTLSQSLDSIIEALTRAELTQEQFFDALQAISSQTMKKPEDISKAKRLVDTGLLPAFIKSLPYKSDIMSLSNEMYASMTADERAQLIWSLKAKLIQYRQINERVDAWQKLNESDSDGEKVYPLKIDYLP